MTGYSNGKIQKDNPMTVEQFISILVSASVDESEIGILNASKWSIPYIEKAKELNYIKPGEFKEKDYTRAITRGEANQLGVRAIESIEGSPQYRESERIQLAINDYISTYNKWSNVDKMYFIVSIRNENLDDDARHVVYEYPSKMVRAYGSVYKPLEYKHISKFNFKK